MKSVLVIYMSRQGHTARVARRLCESIVEAGGKAAMMDVCEATHEGVDWDRHDGVALGAPVLYGTYDKSFLAFVTAHKADLDRKPNSFFNVSVVARTPEKATPAGNRYMQKFLEISPASKYPNINQFYPRLDPVLEQGLVTEKPLWGKQKVLGTKPGAPTERPKAPQAAAPKEPPKVFKGASFTGKFDSRGFPIYLHPEQGEVALPWP